MFDLGSPSDAAVRVTPAVQNATGLVGAPIATSSGRVVFRVDGVAPTGTSAVRASPYRPLKGSLRARASDLLIQRQ